MAASSSEVWQEVFTKWPAAIPKRGLVISTLNEPTPFKSFFTKGDTLLLERTNPDPMGARFVLLTYDAIHMLKLIDPIKESTFNEAGYVGHFAKS